MLSLNNDQDGKFYFSPTYGALTLNILREKALYFIEQAPEKKYHLIIGTDSQPKNGQGADFVTAVVIHRVGYGGIYFWKRIIESKKMILRTRIYQEAALSLACAQEVLEVFKDDGITKYDIEIHVDIGAFGSTKDMISEVVGMVRSFGFNVKTKPDSYGASKVADRHT